MRTSLGIGLGITRQGAFSSLINPLTLSPLAFYDLSDLTTLFQDSAGTTPVTADGQVVGLVKDKSGNANDLSQATTSLKPIWHTSGGISWIEFDGVDDALIYPVGASPTNAHTICASVRQVSTPAAECNIVSLANYRLQQRVGGASGKWGTFSGATGVKPANTTLTNGQSCVLSMKGSSGVDTSGNFFFNGANDGSYDQSSSGSNPFGNIRIYSIFIKASALNNSDFAALNTYLGAKGGISI